MIRRVTAAAAALALLFTLAACNPTDKKASKDVQTRGQAVTQQYQRTLEAARPYPLGQMRDSLERANLTERLLRYNKPTKISYIYLLSTNGQVISFYTIKGKVTSNSSQLTTDQIKTDCGTQCGYAVNGPGDDGSYGPNEDGIFFFTTDNVMVTWNGQYLLADAPLKIATPPVIVYQQGSKPTSTGTR